MVYVFLADGFEEMEAITPIDMMRRANLDVRTISITNRRNVVGAHQIEVMADDIFDTQTFDDAEMLVLPGGMPGTLHLHNHEALCEMLRQHNAAGKWIAAICAAPSILGDLGLLDGKHATCYPGFESHLAQSYTGTYVECSHNIITGRGAGVAIPFAHALISALAGKETADKVKAEIQCQN